MIYCFSGSHDQSAMLWVWNVANNSVDCVVTCRGHEKGVECLSVSADASRFATGGWDNNICLWSASKFHKADVCLPVKCIVNFKELVSLVYL